jgi:hypothetical protein
MVNSEKNCSITALLTYINDPNNICDESKYIRRSSVGRSLGFDSQLNMNYLHGVGFISGTIGDKTVYIVKPNPYGTNMNMWILSHAQIDEIKATAEKNNEPILTTLIKESHYVHTVYNVESAVSLLGIKIKGN